MHTGVKPCKSSTIRVANVTTKTGKKTHECDVTTAPQFARSAKPNDTVEKCDGCSAKCKLNGL